MILNKHVWMELKCMQKYIACIGINFECRYFLLCNNKPKRLISINIHIMQIFIPRSLFTCNIWESSSAFQENKGDPPLLITAGFCPYILNISSHIYSNHPKVHEYRLVLYLIRPFEDTSHYVRQKDHAVFERHKVLLDWSYWQYPDCG